MKKITTWMLAAILICGSSVFTACSDKDNPTPKKETQQRQEFQTYANDMLKNIATNLNFDGWKVCNTGAKHICKYVLDNDVVKENIKQVMSEKMKPTIIAIEDNSLLKDLGYTKCGELDLVDFNTKITVVDTKTVTAEESDAFIFEIYGYNPTTSQVEQGLYRIVAKASGESFKGISKQLSKNAGMAIVVKFPEKMDIDFYSKTSGDWKKVLNSTVEMSVMKNSDSPYFDYRNDAFIYNGYVENFIDLQVSPQKKVTDNSTLLFAIGQDPINHEGSVSASFIQNGKEILSASLLFGKVKSINWSELQGYDNFIDLCAKLMQSIELKDMTITLMDDATIQESITDCGEMFRLKAEMMNARENGAGKAVIDEYTQKMNQLLTGKMFIESLNMSMPFKYKTTLMGVDYDQKTAVKFIDENDYVALIDLLDIQAQRYLTNIKDHTTAPLQESVEIMMQITKFMNVITGEILSDKE